MEDANEIKQHFKVSKGKWKETELKELNKNLQRGADVSLEALLFCGLYHLGHCKNLPLRKHLPYPRCHYILWAISGSTVLDD